MSLVIKLAQLLQILDMVFPDIKGGSYDCLGKKYDYLCLGLVRIGITESQMKKVGTNREFFSDFIVNAGIDEKKILQELLAAYKSMCHTFGSV